MVVRIEGALSGGLIAGGRGGGRAWPLLTYSLTHPSHLTHIMRAMGNTYGGERRKGSVALSIILEYAIEHGKTLAISKSERWLDFPQTTSSMHWIEKRRKRERVPLGGQPFTVGLWEEEEKQSKRRRHRVIVAGLPPFHPSPCQNVGMCERASVWWW